MKRKIISFIIFIVVYVSTTLVINDYDNKISTINSKITALDSKVQAIDNQLYSKANKTEIDTILKQLKGYRDKVDGMILNYISLDEILRQMFGESQASYIRRVGK